MSGDTYNNTSDPLYLGCTNGNTEYGQLYMNDFRIYKGVAKYTDEFTPPTRTSAFHVDSVVDSPTNYEPDDGDVRGNYCTINPLDHGSSAAAVLSDGNLTIESGSSNWKTYRGTMGVRTGKWYYEVYWNGGGETSQFGIIGAQANLGLDSIEGNGGMCQAFKNRGLSNGNNDVANYLPTGPDQYKAGWFGCAIDVDAGKYWAHYEGTWGTNGGVGNPATGANPGATNVASLGDVICPAWSGYYNGEASFNFGQRPWKFTCPDGFKAWCTHSLSDTFSGNELNNPSKYFDILTWGGSDSAKTITGLEFQPDLIWIKIKQGQEAAGIIEDAIRGAGKTLVTNNTDAELTNNSSGHIDAFTSDGYTLTGDQQRVNKGGRSYVGWTWDAGTAAATASTDGTNITPSSQWVNATAGFSISKYTGTGTKTDSVGHALNAKPALVIIKDLVAGHSYPGWYVKHKDQASNNNLKWETNAVQYPATGANAWYHGGIADLTSNTVVNFAEGQTADSVDNVNKSGATYIMYCWTGIPGYSKFGKYTGTSNADGPFIYTGFRPKWVMIKNIVDSGPEAWVVLDSERDSINPLKLELAPSTESVEGATELLDFCANGFKIRAGDKRVNDNNGANYLIYAAFAEHPFKTSRAF